MAEVDRQTLDTTRLVAGRAYADRHVPTRVSKRFADCATLYARHMSHGQALDSRLNISSLLLGE